ncbi:efflux RND transporter periplasmic adaptor subunit [Hanamia caeni]|jgi:RND family efflux transporter MFP subunit|uniref:Efflux RND transporter periplasmic adaptor subunit n=1 Tax=Hanamia caeni TaxID=2294116 RepID=A0A3M9NQQ3_9BACT|nr:efflux RND transporter periplasmic adaptor subunit [Hanamia caeni]RNI40014.1 efflux RND transporter periplasmic adaptor subunit [Hanamia caeni]
MKKITTIGLSMLLISFISSCTNSSKDAQLKDKKAQLEKLKSEQASIDSKIESLQKEIAVLDTGSAIVANPKLVALSTVEKGDFKHYLELQGNVDSKNISYITPSGQPGQIKAIYVKQGDKVHKGELILKLDDAVAQQNVTAIKQQMGSVKAQLGLAQSVYDRQKNLWNQNIGTEVQLLQAKTNVETLQNQLKAIEAQVKTAQEQANQSNVYSDVNGTVDEITAHVGETFNGNPLTGGYIKIVNETDLKITVTVPENYSGKVHKGSPVIVTIPDANQTFNGSISFISQAIGDLNRGFTAEIKVPKGLSLRPNQIAKVKILDYNAPNSIAIPLNTIQTGQEGKFVLLAGKEDSVMVAKKRVVTIGQFYGDSIEVKSGLQPGDKLITEGFQGLFEGDPIFTASK